MVGQTIMQQLKTLGQVEMWSWGSNAFKIFSDKNFNEQFGTHQGGLMFQVQGALFKGKVFIALSYMDTYDIYFGTLRAGQMKISKQYKDIYVDQLVEIIDRHVETA